MKIATCAGSRHIYRLRRQGPTDSVTGDICLGFAWDVTARSLLGMKLATLERVLAQRMEILCLLRPFPTHTVQHWLDMDAAAREHEPGRRPSAVLSRLSNMGLYFHSDNVLTVP